MKLYTLLFFLLPASVSFTQTDSMIVELINGSIRSYALSSISQIDFSDGSTGVMDQHLSNSVPKTFRLLQNYPNPFNPTTNILYEIPHSGSVEIAIFDINGRIIRSYMGSRQEQGRHSVVWDGRNNSNVPVSSGVYFCRVLFENRFLINKLVLIK